MSRASRRERGGFTLIEVLVALAILAVAVVAVLQLFGGGLRLARASADHLEATLLAGQKLAEVDLESIEEGTTEGTEGSFRWTLRVAPDSALAPEEPDPARPPGPRLARVSVEVRWGRNREVELVTLRTIGEKK